MLVTVRFGNVRFAGGGDCNEFQIRANTTSLGANNGLPTNAPIDIGGNGSTTVPTYLDLNGYNQAILGVKNTVSGGVNLAFVTNSGAGLNTLTLNPGTGNTYSFGGGVVGKVALVLNSGQQTFTGTVGTNAYSGNTTVNGGTLELANDTIATNSTVTIASGATLQLDFSTTNQVGALVLGGVTQSPGVYNNTTSPTFIAGSGSLIVVPPVNTTPTNLIASVSGSTLTLTWPADHTGWKLQAQTNGLNSGLSTNWVTIPGTDASNTYTATLNSVNGAVFYRMVYP
jgi:autotransporter-associated beta strand protein